MPPDRWIHAGIFKDRDTKIKHIFYAYEWRQIDGRLCRCIAYRDENDRPFAYYNAGRNKIDMITFEPHLANLWQEFIDEDGSWIPRQKMAGVARRRRELMRIYDDPNYVDPFHQTGGTVKAPGPPVNTAHAFFQGWDDPNHPRRVPKDGENRSKKHRKHRASDDDDSGKDDSDDDEGKDSKYKKIKRQLKDRDSSLGLFVEDDEFDFYSKMKSKHKAKNKKNFVEEEDDDDDDLGFWKGISDYKPKSEKKEKKETDLDEHSSEHRISAYRMRREDRILKHRSRSRSPTSPRKKLPMDLLSLGDSTSRRLDHRGSKAITMME